MSKVSEQCPALNIVDRNGLHTVERLGRNGVLHAKILYDISRIACTAAGD